MIITIYTINSVVLTVNKDSMGSKTLSNSCKCLPHCDYQSNNIQFLHFKKLKITTWKYLT